MVGLSSHFASKDLTMSRISLKKYKWKIEKIYIEYDCLASLIKPKFSEVVEFDILFEIL